MRFPVVGCLVWRFALLHGVARNSPRTRTSPQTDHGLKESSLSVCREPEMPWRFD